MALNSQGSHYVDVGQLRHHNHLKHNLSIGGTNKRRGFYTSLKKKSEIMSNCYD